MSSFFPFFCPLCPVFALSFPGISFHTDTKHLNENDHIFKSEKFCKRFPDFKITTPQEAAAEIVLIEGTHMTLQAEGKAFHEKKVIGIVVVF